MVWFPKLLSGSGNTDFRINGAKLRWVFSFSRKTVRIAVFPDKCIPDKRGFTVKQLRTLPCQHLYLLATNVRLSTWQLSFWLLNDVGSLWNSSVIQLLSDHSWCCLIPLTAREKTQCRLCKNNTTQVTGQNWIIVSLASYFIAILKRYGLCCYIK